MQENNYGYTPENDGYDDNYYDEADNKKSLLGYKIVICILAVILAALSVLYFNINRQQKRDYDLLSIERDSIQSDLGKLIDEYDELQYQNDTIAARLVEANEMMEQLKKERRLNYAKIKEYEKEVGTLRSIMKTYLRQIDSLNNLNQQLITENVNYRKEISSANLRAEMAEEKAQELDNKVRQGSILYARNITLAGLNKKGNTVSRIKQAVQLRADFTLAANNLTEAGSREIYVRITAPDGYLLSTDSTPSFAYEGGTLNYSASREVDYENEDLNVSIFYSGSGFTAGTYKIEIYTDGLLVGSNEVTLK